MTLDVFLRVVSAASTLLIGVAASWLAYQQFKISRVKLKFELYEKRLALFRIVREFASDIAINHTTNASQTLSDTGKFYRDTIEHRFLFNTDVSAYFDDVYQKAKALADVELELSRPNITMEERTTINKQVAVLMTFQRDLSIRTLK